MSEQLLRKWVHHLLINEDTEQSTPSNLKGIEWKDVTQGTISAQIDALAKLTAERYPNNFLNGTGGESSGTFTISPGTEAGDAYAQAYATSTGRNLGLKAEDGLMAYYAVLGHKSKEAATGRQAGGEDIVLNSGEIGELKTSAGGTVNKELNSTAPHNDPRRYYIFMKGRDAGTPQVSVVNSQLLYYRNFVGLAGEENFNLDTGEINLSGLETKIRSAMQKALGNVDLDDLVTQTVMSTRPQEAKLSFSLGGLSVRLRMMFNLKSVPSKDDLENITDEPQQLKLDLSHIQVNKGRPMLSENAVSMLAPIAIREEIANFLSSDYSQLRSIIRDTLMLEELTKSDKKEIERISRKQAKKEIDKVVGTSLEKTIQKEVEKTLKNKASKDEITDITKSVMKKLYKDLSFTYPGVIDRIKV